MNALTGLAGRHLQEKRHALSMDFAKGHGKHDGKCLVPINHMVIVDAIHQGEAGFDLSRLRFLQIALHSSEDNRPAQVWRNHLQITHTGWGWMERTGSPVSVWYHVIRPQ